MTKEKSPAFQFYPKDLLSDINWVMMTYPEKGMYWQLLSICWLEGSIPADLGAISRILQVNPEVAEEAWKMIGKCFQVHCSDCSKLVHPRLEIERQKQEERRVASSIGGKHSSGKRKNIKDISPQQCTSLLLASKRQVNLNPSSPSSSANNIKRERRAVARICPEDFAISDQEMRWAIETRPDLNIKLETEKFRNYEFKNPKTDWHKTWKNWILNATTSAIQSKSIRPKETGLYQGQTQVNETDIDQSAIEQALRLKKVEGL